VKVAVVARAGTNHVDGKLVRPFFCYRKGAHLRTPAGVAGPLKRSNRGPVEDNLGRPPPINARGVTAVARRADA